MAGWRGRATRSSSSDPGLSPGAQYLSQRDLFTISRRGTSLLRTGFAAGTVVRVRDPAQLSAHSNKAAANRILNRWRRQGGSPACQRRARSRYCAPPARAGWGSSGNPGFSRRPQACAWGTVSLGAAPAPGTQNLSWNVPLTFEPFLPSPWIHVDRHWGALLSDNIPNGIVHCSRTPQVSRASMIAPALSPDSICPIQGSRCVRLQLSQNRFSLLL